MRLAIIVSHPTQYYSPWFRHIAGALSSTGQDDALKVFYLWDFGVTPKTDRGFGRTVEWDTDLLSGYDHEFVRNVSVRPGTDWFGGLDNPDLRKRVAAFGPDSVLQFGYNHKSLVAFDLCWDTKRAPLMFRGDSHLLADHDRAAAAIGQSINRVLRKVGLRMLFARFSCFLSVGRANKAYFTEHGVPSDRIVFCPHAVDNDFFAVRPEGGSARGGLRGELGIPADELVFLFAGKLEEKKQPVQLLEAFSEANTGRSTLIFAGSGGLEGALLARLSRGDWKQSGASCFEKESKRVLLLPFQNQSRMPDVYRTGDVLVLPSRGRYETWGLAVNEAACCSLPSIVGSHVGCWQDLIIPGQTGWVFPSGDTSALARVLEKASADKNQLPDLGAAMREKVLREYCYDRATRVLLAAARAVSQGAPARKTVVEI